MSADVEIEKAKAGSDALKKEKLRLILEIQQINQDLRITLPRSQYLAKSERRTTLAQEIASCDEAIVRATAEIRRLAAVDRAQQQVAKSSGEKSPSLEDLVQLRNFYQEYSADGSRVASRRQMAAEFALKLGPIIKGWLNERKNS